MRKFVAAAMAALAINSVQAQQWIQAAESDDTVYSVRSDSPRVITVNGQKVVQVLEQARNKLRGRTEVYFVRIPVDHCTRGYGVMFDVDFDDAVKNRTNFAFDGTNIASITAKMYCTAAISGRTPTRNL